MTEIFENNQLQFAQVLTQVASYAKSPEARNLLLQAQPLTKPAAVTHLLDETEEGTRLLERSLQLPFVSSDSLLPLINRAQKGLLLSADDLEKVADYLRVCELLQRFLYREKDLVPILNSYGEELQLFPKLVEQIYQSIEHGQVADSADRDLRRLRRQEQELSQEIKDTAGKLLQSKKVSQSLQEQRLVEKDGHLTLPVKSSFKKAIAGRIIAYSANGQTAFILPRKLDQLSSEKIAVKGQIEAIEAMIFGQLTAAVYEESPGLLRNIDVVAAIDQIMAQMLACLVFSALLTYYGNLSLEQLIQSYLQQIRQELALHIFNDGQAHDPAQAQNQLLKEGDLLTVSYLRNIYSSFKAGMTVLASGGALLSFHWSLFIACLIFALVQISLPRLLDRQLNHANQRLATQNQAYLKVLGDWLLGLGDLHRCLSLAWFKEKAGLAAKELEDAHVHKSAVSARLDYLNQLAYSLGSSLILLLTAFLVIQHWTAFGLLSSIASFNSDFFGNLQNAADYLGEISGSRQLRQDLLKQREAVPEQKEAGQAPAAFASSPLTVEFNGLSLAYPAIKLQPGEKVLLTGASGRGKSTFFKLLLGEVKAASGEIHYLDQKGQVIQPNLSQIGYLPQDPQLFPGSVAENMTMFNPALNDQDLLRQTADQVNLSEDLRLWPAGLDTRVAVEDSNISGGQRQKIVLARSYLYHSQLLLIDEGTSAIDQAATREIIVRLLKTDKTIMFVAHNLTADSRQLFDREIQLD
ncbi:ATP-binding cassette domain-containing protein [Lactobacillus delbrueckii]|uniref:ATP-binding cassette domain-containing protein n=1 Tax=Lactobacillus delbrueckii TaxID=1584 RepID=UPI001C34CE0D|nr:ATP-binding cassette domain-containing protein [Lactobacillus delbrueckii]MBT9023910.1 hypothetical protein [Lactobacillus delbrueckii subsp. bulgaricus]MCD5459958.1 ATP-binding cassette domain-containing protein [Lactobacillus delbrueckii subsp. bulgaricus]